MIRVYKSKIVVYTRNWKTTFFYSLDFAADGDFTYKWEDAEGNSIHAWGMQPLKKAVKEIVSYIATMIAQKHCIHNEVPAGTDCTRCNKCGMQMSYKGIKFK